MIRVSIEVEELPVRNVSAQFVDDGELRQAARKVLGALSRGAGFDPNTMLPYFGTGLMTTAQLNAALDELARLAG